ncbi:hypothetical protein CRI77_24635 [Mycolicibacterium duvalii]|uniref:Uncharacterized protein n=1 Tax=Mycolicibacterium duvalii TaxID=39688 RepID=A0A7I7K2J0_9MYCO|nr:TIR domain-containing protein [Mycolicibacterium duvalii]MCV7369861.1 TIR domain-containing protein [Mycolicibacterium duvalii]PEG35767.1 hypothetical protein CRI77_24635 [Mycolicibacterium duvalii]BBX17592.1 hypothetical protein MDUV_24520 [Mycolicibacterium duvalii]
MSRIFLSHSSRDARQAVALKQWLVEQTPPLANEIFLDVDPASGLRTGTRWKDALRQANARCEAVVCLLSTNWEASHECKVEYRTAENLNKQIFVARLQPSTGDDLTSEWQRCDLFGDGPVTAVDIGGGPPVEFSTAGLYRLRDGIRGAGIGAESFVWPPPDDPDRAPYRGWEPLEESDAAVFFGRDAQIVRALDTMRGMRVAAIDALLVILGPSGSGKSSFLRAGLLPRLRREDRRFVLMDIVRPERNALTGTSGFAAALAGTRRQFDLPAAALGDIKQRCAVGDVDAVAGWMSEIRQAAARRLLDRDTGEAAVSAPTLVLPLDQAEELFGADTGPSAEGFLRLLAGVAEIMNADDLGLVVTATIRTDRYEVMQTHPALAGLGTVLFDELKPMPPTQFKEVITGPAARATESGRPLQVAPDLVDRLLADSAEGADTLPILALTLSRLYVDYGGTGELTLRSYENLGGMRRVVQTEIDEVLSRDPQQRAAELSALRAAFIPWLATINADSDQPMRRVARWADLPAESRPLIDALVAKRLMVKDNRDGQVVVEVALESLLRQWDELAGWLRDERKDLKDADDLERAAAAWSGNDHNPSWLLEGSRLAEAIRLANEPGFRERLASTHPFLDASHQREQQRRAAEEQQRRAELTAAQERAQHAQERQATAEAHAATLRRRSTVLRAVLAGTAVVAVVAVVTSIVAVLARGQAQHRFQQATAVRLVSEADGILAGSRFGSDEQAFQQILAARVLDQQIGDDAVYRAVVSRDDTVRIMRTSTPMDAVAVSPDGRLIAAGGRDDGVRVWNLDSGELIAERLGQHRDDVLALAFSPDGATLASAGRDTVLLWAVDDLGATPREVKGRTGAVGAVAFSPDGRRIATGGWDGNLQMWDGRSGAAIGAPLPAHADGIYALAFSPDGRQLATGSGDESVRLWDVESSREIGAPLTGHFASVRSVAFSRDGKFLASGSLDGTVRIWDVAAGTLAALPLTDHRDGVFSVAFSPDGSVLASGGGDNAVRLWDTQSFTPLGEPLMGHQFEVFGVAFAPDGHRLVSSSYDQSVRLWDIQHLIPAQQRGVWSVAVSPDGSRIVSGGLDGTVRFWDAATGRGVGAPLTGHENSVGPVAFSPGGDRVVSGSDDRTLRIWDAESGRPIGGPLVGHTGALYSAAFSPDGTRIVSGADDRTVRLWDARTGEQIGAPLTGHTGAVLTTVFSPDGGRVASGSADQTIRLWDTTTGEQIGDTIGGAIDWVNSIVYTADGDRFVSGTGDGQLRVWDAGTGQQVGEPLRGHTDSVMSVAISGTSLASGSADRTVRQWDLASLRPVGEPLTGHSQAARSVAIDHERGLIVSGSADGTVRLWPTRGTAEELCAKLTSNMSRQQWDQWVSPEIDYVATCPGLPTL